MRLWSSPPQTVGGSLSCQLLFVALWLIPLVNSFSRSSVVAWDDGESIILLIHLSVYHVVFQPFDSQKEYLHL
jgi:hypothetical protein